MRRKLWTVAVLAVVLAWSTVMTALGQLAAVLALLPPLGLLVQQLAGVRAAETSEPVASTPEPGPEEEHR